MKKAIYVLLAIVLPSIVFISCDNGETYADMKKKERTYINQYIADNNINVISMTQFHAQDSVTDVSKNEFVLFDETGVYMQIERKGEGERVEDGETKTIICRYMEYSIEDADTTTANIYSSSIPDIMKVSNSSGTYTSYFTSGMMYSYYSSSSVPSGWLVPLPYIYLTRNTANIAKVRLIVPHSQGTSTASSNVYPFYYEITYELGR